MKSIGINFENEIIHFFKSNQRTGESFSKTVNRLLKEHFIDNSAKKFVDDYSKSLELLVTILIRYTQLLRSTEKDIPFHDGFKIIVKGMNLQEGSVKHLANLLKGNFQTDIGYEYNTR